MWLTVNFDACDCVAVVYQCMIFVRTVSTPPLQFSQYAARA
jgi:hypothetical protein